MPGAYHISGVDAPRIAAKIPFERVEVWERLDGKKLLPRLGARDVPDEAPKVRPHLGPEPVKTTQERLPASTTDGNFKVPSFEGALHVTDTRTVGSLALLEVVFQTQPLAFVLSPLVIRKK